MLSTNRGACKGVNRQLGIGVDNIAFLLDEYKKIIKMAYLETFSKI